MVTKQLCQVTVRFVPSVHLSARNSVTPSGQIFIKLRIWDFLYNLSMLILVKIA